MQKIQLILIEKFTTNISNLYIYLYVCMCKRAFIQKIDLLVLKLSINQKRPIAGYKYSLETHKVGLKWVKPGRSDY